MSEVEVPKLYVTDAELDKRVSRASLDMVSSSESEADGVSVSSRTLEQNEKASTDYSADIRPLMIKMTLPQIHEPFDSSQNDDNFDHHAYHSHYSSTPSGFAKVRRRLHNVPKSSLLWYNSINENQLEDYLREPSYIKVYRKRRDMKRFSRLFMAQELKAYDSNADRSAASTNSLQRKNTDTSKAIWATKFSTDGKLLATGGKDGTLRIWKVINSPTERWELNNQPQSRPSMPHSGSTSSSGRGFLRRRRKTISSNHSDNNDEITTSGKTDIDSLGVSKYVDSMSKSNNINTNGSNLESSKSYSNSSEQHAYMDNEGETLINQSLGEEEALNLFAPVFMPRPIVLHEHSQDILDLEWSKNNFIVTSSSDKTVKLWHPEKKQSLKTFKHPDFVTSVIFHSGDDRFFISGCLDQKCRVWSILDGSVEYEYDCKDLITSLTVSPDDGEFTIIGTLNGYIHVLRTHGLEYMSSFHVRERKTLQDKDDPKALPPNYKAHHGPRITGMQCFKPEELDSLRLLVTCDDSKIRVIDLETKRLLEYLKGYHSNSTQHNAQISSVANNPVVISSSDDHWIYAWKLQSCVHEDNIQPIPKTGVGRSSHITHFFKNSLRKNSVDSKTRPRSSSRKSSNLHISNILPCRRERAIRNSSYVSFHAHSAPVTTAVVAPEETLKTLALSNDFICELSLEYFNTDFSNENGSGRSQLNRSKSNSESSNSSTPNGTSTSFSSAPTSRTLSSKSSTLPNMVDAVGTILVSTDNLGTIRVFRVDMPSKIREMVLQKLRNKRRAEKDAASNNLSGQKSNLNSKMDPKCNLLAKASTVQDAQLTTSCELFPKNCSPLNTQELQHKTSNLALNLSRLSPPSLPSDAQCDVCNSTKFKYTCGDGKSSEGPAYYCVDCGNMYTTFR